MIKCYCSVLLILFITCSVSTECDESLNDMTKKAAVDCKSIKKCNLKTMNFTDKGKEYICKQVIEKEHKLYTFFKPYLLENNKININAVKSSKNFDTTNDNEKKFILLNLDDVIDPGKVKDKEELVRHYPQEQHNIDNSDIYDALMDDIADKATQKKTMVSIPHRERHFKLKPSKKPGQTLKTPYSEWPKNPGDKLTNLKSDKHREMSRIEFSSVGHPEKRIVNKTTRYRTAGLNGLKNPKATVISVDVKNCALQKENPVSYYDDVEEDDEFNSLYQDEAVTGSQRDVKPKYLEVPRTSFSRTRHNSSQNTDQYLERCKI